MYLDESIRLSDNLPQSVMDNTVRLEEYYREDNSLEWIRLMEEIDIDVRALAVSGRITEQEAYDVLRRYGWR